jgi:beta-carotene 3-hydroxylase
MKGFIAIVALTFVATEMFSWAIHRYVYHKALWFIHKSHHTTRRGALELNDIFPVIFAAVSVLLMVVGLQDPSHSNVLPISVGIMAYGGVYFVVHDLYIHRRVRRIALRIPLLLPLKKAHAVHHRTGGEPYGLLFFLHPRQTAKEPVKDEDQV